MCILSSHVLFGDGVARVLGTRITHAASVVRGATTPYHAITRRVLDGRVTHPVLISDGHASDA